MTKTFCDFCGAESSDLFGEARRFLDAVSYAPGGGMAQTLNVQKTTMGIQVVVSLQGDGSVGDAKPSRDPTNICDACFHRIVSEAIAPPAPRKATPGVTMAKPAPDPLPEAA